MSLRQLPLQSPIYDYLLLPKVTSSLPSSYALAATLAAM